MKTKQILAILSPFIVLVFTQCKKEGSYASVENINGHEMIHCDISQVKDSIDLPLSEIVSDCQMVRLETNDESLFKGTHLISVSENYMAIKSSDYPPITVKLFNRDGKFIRNIGAIGKGPGEYQSLYGLQLDEKNKRIYLTPFANAKSILVYSLEGEALPSIPLKYGQTKCRVHINNDVVTVLSMPFNDKIPVAYQQTLQGEVIRELPVMQHLILRPDYSSEVSSDYNAEAFDQYIMTWGKETPDTLYHYETDKNQLAPKFLLTKGNARIGSWPRELKRHFYSFLWDEPYQNKKVIVDKKSLKADFFRLYNDFYGNIELHKFYMSANGIFVAAMPAMELMESIDRITEKSGIDRKELDKLAAIRQSLDANDNEILFIGEMK